jgi:hydroxymethylbilane synthase
MTSPIRVGTRASALALWQTERVRTELGARGVATRRIEITTTGDAVLDVPLARIGSVALFTRQLDEALLDGRIDCAVHSLKDLPSRLPEGIVLAAVSDREDPRDALVAKGGARFADLPVGATIATSSLRRRAQLLAARPDFRIVDVRGNVQTRLRHLDESPDWDATMLAVAGLVRLGLAERITERLPVELLLPAPGQGALAVTARADDAATIAVLHATMHDEATGLATAAERGFLRALDGGCQVPIAALASAMPEAGEWQVTLTGRVGSLDGREVLAGARAGTAGTAPDAWALGVALGEQLLADGAGAILDAARRTLSEA